MDLILSFKRVLSTFLIISFPLGVLMVLLSLILTGIRSWLRHLRENLWWLEKSAILFSIFSHQLNVSTFSLSYSLLICIKNISHTPCVCSKIAGITFSSDLRKTCLITGESLSPPTKTGPVHEKITYYIYIYIYDDKAISC